MLLIYVEIRSAWSVLGKFANHVSLVNGSIFYFMLVISFIINVLILISFLCKHFYLFNRQKKGILVIVFFLLNINFFYK